MMTIVYHCNTVGRCISDRRLVTLSRISYVLRNVYVYYFNFLCFAPIRTKLSFDDDLTSMIMCFMVSMTSTLISSLSEVYFMANFAELLINDTIFN